jgi:hypothetical protein
MGISANNLDERYGPSAYEPFARSLSTIVRSLGKTPTVLVNAAIAVFMAATLTQIKNETDQDRSNSGNVQILFREVVLEDC